MTSITSIKNDIAEHVMWNLDLQHDCIRITNDDEIDVYLAHHGHQIIIESLLFESDAVIDSASLNDHILRTHQLLPLSSVGIKNIGGVDYYIAFGALSSTSSSQDIIHEIDVLMSNIPKFVSAYSDHIRVGEPA
ncbi:YjfI family protein [Halomonas sp. DP5Y7-2]|uniref:DUF2170 family protein n=1 Tax=Halomonas sp. DP5Y7-2 TaxID=2859076 RepID=UPI001C99FF62|nr:DUF2170 family protein [Halomonas sp. DP5Y7-2]MBY5984698.1 YjfI family protein [Halomonas sp. DP5Y7-2]